jgi:hypothetical protein
MVAQCGVVVDPVIAGAAGKLAEVVQGWVERTEEAVALGRRGREAFLREYEKEHCCEQFSRVICPDQAGVSR